MSMLNSLVAGAVTRGVLMVPIDAAAGSAGASLLFSGGTTLLFLGLFSRPFALSDAADGPGIFFGVLGMTKSVTLFLEFAPFCMAWLAKLLDRGFDLDVETRLGVVFRDVGAAPTRIACLR